MSQRLKRWESPRREGRNDKGKGGSARQRQLRKQRQTLIKKLKQSDDNQPKTTRREEDVYPLPFWFIGVFPLPLTGKCHPRSHSLINFCLKAKSAE